MILLKKKDSVNYTRRERSNLWSGMEIQGNAVNSLRKSCNFIVLATFSVLRQCFSRLVSEAHPLLSLPFCLKCYLYILDLFQGVSVTESSRLDGPVVKCSQHSPVK